jgi:hypothetical protein
MTSLTDTNPQNLLIEHDELLAKLSDVLWNNGLNSAARDVDAAVERLHNFLAQPEPTLTVQGCNDMPKHRFNFLYEDFTGEIVLDGFFTREDLIEIANTVPSTEV